MIISAGYNIAGPEVEAALLAHPEVAECAAVGATDTERGQVVAPESVGPLRLKTSRALRTPVATTAS